MSAIYDFRPHNFPEIDKLMDKDTFNHGLILSFSREEYYELYELTSKLYGGTHLNLDLFFVSVLKYMIAKNKLGESIEGLNEVYEQVSENQPKLCDTVYQLKDDNKSID